jgi:TonB family protein
MARYIVIFIAVAAMFYVGMEILSRPADQPRIIKSSNYNAQPGREISLGARTPVAAGVVLPAEEQEFIRAVQQSQIAFQSAPNEMAAGGIRFQRRVAICRILPAMFVSKWLGRITTQESNSDGKGVLEISLADGISVKTWNNDISDIGDHTLIEPSSALFAAVSQRKVGDQVFFAGTFFPGNNDVDCVKEASVSLHGSMQEPEFVFRFADVREASDREVTNTAATLPAPPEVTSTTRDDPESQKLLADGRVYSVALVVGTDVSLGTEVLAQGKVARFGYQGMRSRPFAVIEDEQQPGKTLLCAMKGEEGAEVVSLYHVGELVRVSGEYMGIFDFAGMPVLSNCKVAGPQSNVVRAAEIANPVSDEHLDEDSAVYKVGGGVSAPKAVFAPDPEYSEEARRAKLQGKCVLWLVVGTDGFAHDIRVAQKLGLGLDEKAIEAVMTWKFEPAMQDGRPVAVQINVEVIFRLHQSGQIDSGSGAASDDAVYKDWQKRHGRPQ